MNHTPEQFALVSLELGDLAQECGVAARMVFHEQPDGSMTAKISVTPIPGMDLERFRRESREILRKHGLDPRAPMLN